MNEGTRKARWVVVVSCLVATTALAVHALAQANPPAPPGQSKRVPFLSQSRDVGPRIEWNREVTSPSGGTFEFLVTSQQPFGVTVVTGKAHDALVRGDRAAFSKADVVMTIDVRGTRYEGRVTVPPGSSWFILQNQSDMAVTFTLQCYTTR